MTTKKQVINAAKKYFNDDMFEVDLYKEGNKNKIILNNTINLYVEIGYENNRDKNYIYNCIIELLKCFDFSYTLEYYSIENLENCPFLTTVGY